jgi:ferritin-like metal-binding protein YciE
MPAEISMQLDNDSLKQVFIHNLNRIYFGKCYLNSHLEHLRTRASFPSFQLAIDEFWEDIKKQIKRMQVIYELLDEIPSDKNCNPIKSIIKDDFCLDDDQGMPVFTDTDLIVYLQLLEHINITACRTLKTLASILEYDEAEQLLTECFDESIDNDHLFQLISKEYFTTE